MLTLDEAITLAINKLDNNTFIGLNVTYSSAPIFSIKRNNNNIDIKYSCLVEVFRALSYIKEHIKETNYDITITPNFKSNGLMLECSRNGVVNLNTVKDIILLEALMGQNRLLLYTEDTYKLDKYPYFGYFRGPYTKDELKEIVDYASSFGVEVIPCIQTLGHLNRFLHWEPNLPMSDGDTTLLIDEEKTYEFIEECIKFSRECFLCKEIHIGMDESTEIGLGRYLGLHKYEDRVTLFMRHLSRVIEICKKYDFEPMIWSDMFFRLNSPDLEYYRDTPLPKETLKIIPEGINLVYWDYYHYEKEIYDRMNKYHQDAGRKTIFAGGAWRWKGYTPAIYRSLLNSREAMKSCVDNKIDNVFVTAWGDNGNECSIYPILPIMALYANYDYFKKDDNESISSLLKAITGDSLDLFLKLDLPDQPDKKALLPQYNPSKYFLYQDPLCGIFDKQVKPHFSNNYLEFSETLKKASNESRDYGYVYQNLSLLCLILKDKVELGVNLRKAYKANDKKLLKDVNETIPSLIKNLDDFDLAIRKQWNKENKPFGFDVIDGRLGYLKNRLNTTYNVVNEYLNGQIDKMDELDVDVLPFNGHDYEISWNWWINTVTTNYL